MKVKLLTQEVKRRLKPLYSTDGHASETRIAVKFFTPDSHFTWYVIEGEEQENGDWLFFGLCCGMDSELGYVTLSQLQSIRGKLGLPVERDRHFGDHLLKEFMP